jgi:hypothetical protein
MICDAEKRAAVQALTPEDSPPVDCAKSIRARFEVIEKIVDLSVPLRRPKRRTPNREVEQDIFDAHLARQALAEHDEIQPYSEFRKDLGLAE